MYRWSKFVMKAKEGGWSTKNFFSRSTQNSARASHIANPPPNRYKRTVVRMIAIFSTKLDLRGQRHASRLPVELLVKLHEPFSVDTDDVQQGYKSFVSLYGSTSEFLSDYVDTTLYKVFPFWLSNKPHIELIRESFNFPEFQDAAILEK
jgi:hypothetical protein